MEQVSVISEILYCIVFFAAVGLQLKTKVLLLLAPVDLPVVAISSSSVTLRLVLYPDNHVIFRFTSSIKRALILLYVVPSR
jgi:Kef-type K+ transport system membrane component KefB